MRSEGITDATKYAILNANYMKARLEEHYCIRRTKTHKDTDNLLTVAERSTTL
jgi:glycine cleavage system protein P-like pyridoxal-binding family